MVNNSKQKMKQSVFLFFIVSFIAIAAFLVFILSPYLHAYLPSHVFPSLPPTANSTSTFYGENIDMSQILPGSQHYVVNSRGQDLIDIAATLGINLVRITDIQRGFDSNEHLAYTKEQWDLVLNKMQSKGMKAIILIETAYGTIDYTTPEISPAYLHLVQAYIDSGVFANPDVYAVDIKNEPLLTDANIRMLQAAHAMIKAKYPQLKQTIGWWATPNSPQDPYNPNNYNWSDYASGQKIAGMVDFFSIHLYDGLETDNPGIGLNPDLKTKVFISQVENGLQTSKPILIEEFGAANGDAVSDQDTIGSPQFQANIYKGVYQALTEMHSGQILGSVAFDFYSRTSYPDAWAIVKNNGDYLFPAAYILQEYALEKNNPALQTATTITSQSYLLANSDNHTSKNLHLSDRIGLKLQFDSSKNYMLALSARGLLQPLNAFHYEPDSNSYTAVYSASSQGTLQLSILSLVPCRGRGYCTEPVYELTIHIE